MAGRPIAARVVGVIAHVNAAAVLFEQPWRVSMRWPAVDVVIAIMVEAGME